MQSTSLMFKLLKLRFFLSSSKNSKKNLTSYCFVTFYFSYGSGVGSESGSVRQRYGSADPDAYQKVTEPQHYESNIRILHR
jgi:hypothetical protein